MVRVAGLERWRPWHTRTCTAQSLVRLRTALYGFVRLQELPEVYVPGRQAQLLPRGLLQGLLPEGKGQDVRGWLRVHPLPRVRGPHFRAPRRPRLGITQYHERISYVSCKQLRIIEGGGVGEEVAYPRMRIMRIMHVSHSAYHGVSQFASITRITAYHERITLRVSRSITIRVSRVSRISHM